MVDTKETAQSGGSSTVWRRENRFKQMIVYVHEQMGEKGGTVTKSRCSLPVRKLNGKEILQKKTN